MLTVKLSKLVGQKLAKLLLIVRNTIVVKYFEYDNFYSRFTALREALSVLARRVRELDLLLVEDFAEALDGQDAERVLGHLGAPRQPRPGAKTCEILYERSANSPRFRLYRHRFLQKHVQFQEF